jgi:hypothetical protein
MKPRLILSIAFVCLLLAAGCAGTLTNTVAVYTHSDTGQVMECVKEPSMAQGGGVIGGAITGNPYADCKNTLEAQGYKRTGTYSLSYTDQPLPSSSTPRPAAAK